jgi:hypothetical protein
MSAHQTDAAADPAATAGLFLAAAALSLMRPRSAVAEEHG